MVIKIDDNIKINKNMMIISSDQLIHFINEFKICVPKNEFKNCKEIRKDMQLMIFCRNIYDCILIKEIDENEINFTLTVCFNNNNIQLIKNNEYIIIRHINNFIVGKTIVQ